jgi:2,4-dienoyl-CoA reductase-like NADH-dependent reductase (Old Yellow Enzyme family)
VTQVTANTPERLRPLFEPITLRGTEVRNRIVMTGHGTGMARDHLPSEQHVAYYRERARGGVGLIGMAFPQIHPSSQDVPGEPHAYDPAVVPGLRRIAEAAHEHGARIVMQLGHGGRQGHSTFTERALWAPSAIPCPFNLEMPKQMEPEDIEEIIEGHVLGARHAAAAGMDGVEIHSGYGGYLLASFLSRFSNERDDEYGGSLENRMRIVLRTVAAVRAEVGDDCLVGINLQGHDYSPDGLEPADARRIAVALTRTGALDYIVVKAATYYEAHLNVPDMQHGTALWAPLAAAVRAVVDIPVIAVGRINDPNEAAEVLRRGDADMVALTRQQIADPHTVNKVAAGRLRDIRPCIGCNQGCIDRLFEMQHSSCVHNPAAGYELELGEGTLRPTPTPRRVVVLGAGPAGMKAAEIAARRGFEVALLERRSVTGGQLRLAARISGRAEIAGVVSYLDEQLRRLDVDVRLEADLSAPDIIALDPAHVIVATGSEPAPRLIGNRARGMPPVSGLDADHVLSVWDVLEADREIGPRVLVVDDGEGSWKSVGLALGLAADHDVEYATALPHATAKLGPFSGQLATKRLFATDISIRPFTSLVAIEGRSARLLERGRETVVTDLDTVILAGWHQPVTERYFELKRAGVSVTRIGDATAPRTMMEAVHEGERAARAL